jgi:hypothetical protein
MNPRVRRLMWFVGIYLGSAGTLAAATILIRAILRLLIIR